MLEVFRLGSWREAAQVDVSTFASIVTLSNPGFNIASEILETGIRIQCVPKK